MNIATRPLLSEIIQSVDDPVLVLNTSCEVEFFNEKAAQILNIDFVKGQKLPLDELSQSRWNSFVKKLQQEYCSFCTPNIQGKDFTFKQIKMFGMYIKSKNLIYLKVFEERNEKIEKLTMNDDIMNDVSHGIMLFKNGIIVEINTKALELLGEKRECLLGQSFEKMLENCNDYLFSKLQFLSEMRNYGRAIMSISRWNDHGDEIFLKLEAKYNYHSNVTVMTITDETENVLLKKKNTQLQQLSAIGEMTASIAHEIRNPMTSLKGFVDLLKISSSGEGEKYLQVMESELNRMESMLTELLYLSKPMERYEDVVSLLNVADEVIQIMHPKAKKHNISIQLELDHEHLNEKIIGNYNRLKQILINIIKNAIEVMPNGGTITVGLKNVRENIQVYVRDEGIGIPEHHLKNLFTPFFTTKEQGTGLGLALVKKVIDEHNGNIKVESTLDVGTTFIIELPVYVEGLKEYFDDEEKMKNWMNCVHMNRLPVV